MHFSKCFDQIVSMNNKTSVGLDLPTCMWNHDGGKIPTLTVYINTEALKIF